MGRAIGNHSKLTITAKRDPELSPAAIRIAKLNLNYGSDLTYPALVHGMEMLAQTYGSNEALEGMRACLEKRHKDFSRFHRRRSTRCPTCRRKRRAVVERKACFVCRNNFTQAFVEPTSAAMTSVFRKP